MQSSITVVVTSGRWRCSAIIIDINLKLPFRLLSMATQMAHLSQATRVLWAPLGSPAGASFYTIVKKWIWDERALFLLYKKKHNKGVSPFVFFSVLVEKCLFPPNLVLCWGRSFQILHFHTRTRLQTVSVF